MVAWGERLFENEADINVVLDYDQEFGRDPTLVAIRLTLTLRQGLLTPL